MLLNLEPNFLTNWLIGLTNVQCNTKAILIANSSHFCLQKQAFLTHAYLINISCI